MLEHYLAKNRSVRMHKYQEKALGSARSCESPD